MGIKNTPCGNPSELRLLCSRTSQRTTLPRLLFLLQIRDTNMPLVPCIFLRRRAFGTNANRLEIVMSRRETIDTGTDRRHVRHDEQGRLKESVDVGRSLFADGRHKAKNEAKPGEGDRGDRHTTR